MSAVTLGRQLVNCPSCKDNHVYPIDWESVTGGRYAVKVRCPNCENRWTIGPLDDDQIESYDDVLDRGTDNMCCLLNGLTRWNFKHDVEQLLEAIDRGLIDADDFTPRGSAK